MNLEYDRDMYFQIRYRDGSRMNLAFLEFAEPKILAVRIAGLTD